MADLQAIADALIKGDRNTVLDLTKKALDEGVAPGELLEKGLIAGEYFILSVHPMNQVLPISIKVHFAEA